MIWDIATAAYWVIIGALTLIVIAGACERYRNRRNP